MSNLMAIPGNAGARRQAQGIVKPGADLAAGVPRPHSRGRRRRSLGCCARWPIAACDLAKVIGSADRVELVVSRFPPAVWACSITALDPRAESTVVLYLQHRGFRLLEALVVALIATIAGCSCSRSSFRAPTWPPSPWASSRRLILGRSQQAVHPRSDPRRTVIAAQPVPAFVGGARQGVRGDACGASGWRSSSVLDSTVALSFALFINAAILIVGRGHLPPRRSYRGR